jgi:acetylornithine deacetylase
MIGAADEIAQSGGLDAGRIVIACVADEEHASLGADALVTKWHADAAVVTEPTDLGVAVAHKGFEWVEIETRGVAAHGSRPRDGRDAILRMGRVLAELEALDRDLQNRAPHRLLGTASLHASLISGGRELSSYPDRCVLQMERRTLPGERAGVAAQEAADILARLMTRDAEFEATSASVFTRAPLEISPDHALPALLVSEARAIGLPAPVIGMSFWTDAAVLAAAGIPSVLFGPTGAGLHGVDEYVEAGSVLKCRAALGALARAWCRP